MPGSSPLTHHTVQLWAVWIVVLEVFHRLLDFVHAIQVFLQPPSGTANKTKNKKQCLKKQRKKISTKHQTKPRIKIQGKYQFPFLQLGADNGIPFCLHSTPQQNTKSTQQVRKY